MNNQANLLAVYQQYYCNILLTFFISFIVLFYPIHAQNLKIGVVDINYLLENAPETLRYKQRLEEEFAPRESEILKQELKLRELQNKFNNNDQLNAKEQRELEYELIRLDREVKRLSSNYRQDYNLRKNEELLKTQKQVTDEILQYAQQEMLDLVIESNVLYVTDQLVITKKILERLK